MNDSRPNWLIPLAALALLALLDAYPCAYFGSCTLGDPNYGVVRMYRTRWPPSWPSGPLPSLNR